MQKLKLFIANREIESKAEEFYDIYNPSTGEILAKAPKAVEQEIDLALETAAEGFKVWSNVPVVKRAAVLYKVAQLIDENMEELTLSVATEQGKSLKEAKGDVLKAKEATLHAASVPTLMMGESLFDTSVGFDTITVRESMGIFLGLVPFNFPAMIPMGWMAPMCIACGNSMILKLSSSTPMTALKIAQLYKKAGLPDGVLNLVTCGRDKTEQMLKHPSVAGVTFVGSTNSGLNIYSLAAKYGKRVQTLCEAKNHGLVLKDAPIGMAASSIINASFGCAGQRCMALPVVVAENEIADELVSEIISQAKKLKVGAAYDKKTDLGPLFTKSHKESVLKWIDKGIKEGANLVLDGRQVLVEGFEDGFYIGPCIFDNVTKDMEIGKREIFGPVLCIKRVKDFEEGLSTINSNPFGNGAVIYTESGRYAREFARRVDGGMVGVNVGIPVPISLFAFNGHKQSFFGDLHVLGKDGIRFYTKSKSVTTRWFEKTEKATKADTWDGTI